LNGSLALSHAVEDFSGAVPGEAGSKSRREIRNAKFEIRNSEIFGLGNHSGRSWAHETHEPHENQSTIRSHSNFGW
jgi:hypothetical protein